MPQVLMSFWGSSYGADYLFPIVSGVYLALVTARIVGFNESVRELERRIVAAGRRLGEASLRIQKIDEERCLDVARGLVEDIRMIAEDFKAGGHLKAHRRAIEVADDMWRVAGRQIRAPVCGPELSDEENAAAQSCPGFYRLSKASSELRVAEPRHLAMARAIQANYWAFLNVAGAEAFFARVDRLLWKYSRPPTCRCPHCGKPTHDVV